MSLNLDPYEFNAGVLFFESKFAPSDV